jgi:predicted ATPase/DNA-binding XRE family transcriptional regulator
LRWAWKKTCDDVIGRNTLTEVSFGEWLKRRRKAEGLTQEQLARQLNCSTIALRKIEAEERRPSAQIVERLAKIFNIPSNEQRVFLRFARGDWKSAPSAESEEAPWRTSSVSPRSNLPASLTSLIGREQELASVREYLSNPSIRLVTLIGPPGIGKTRLSIEAARAELADFPDGVFFIALAPLENPNLVAQTISQTLGFVESQNRSPLERLRDGIGEKQMLIVLDNCEHLIEEVALIASDLLSTCPRLKILATSREAFHVPGEWLFPLSALSIPTDTQLQSIELKDISEFSALALFAERARAVRPDFTLNTENIQPVTSICTQLDGLPLAIELIAARVRLMSPQTLLESLSGQFTLYADGMRAVSARQKTLHGAIAWSYDLLSPEEQKLFVCLSVFVGGFTLDAAETIFSPTIINKSVSDLIASLLDKSLLQRTFDHEARGSPRFSMLVTVQRFALEYLSQMSDEAEIHNRHLDYFLDLAERAESALKGPAQVEWLARLKNESDNLRATLNWAAKTKAIEAGLYIAGRLRSLRIYLNEGERWLIEFINRPESHNYPMALAKALYAHGSILWQLQRFSEAHDATKESLAISRSCCDRQGEIDGLYLLGSIMQHLDSQESKAEIELEALALAKSLGDRWRQAEVLADLGWDHSDYPRARAYWEEAAQLYREVGDLISLVDLLGALGNLELLYGDIKSAQDRLMRPFN